MAAFLQWSSAVHDHGGDSAQTAALKTVAGRLLGDGLRLHVGEAVGVEVVDQRRLERIHRLGERPLLGLDG